MRYYLVFYLFCATFLFSYNALAGESPDAGVQISPIRFNWTLQSGETRSDKIYATNYSSIPHHVAVSVEDFFVSDDSMQANFYVPDDTHPLKAYDVINWIQAPEDFVLEPGETKEVAFTVTIPEGQPTNGYYGTIFFKTKGDDAAASDGSGVKIGVSYRVGALLTFAVQGEEPMQIKGDLTSIVSKNNIYWNTPIIIEAKSWSSGNIHYKTSGKMHIYKFGKKFATVEIDPEVMYPDRTRTFTEKIPFDQFDHGIYTATISLESEDGSVMMEGETEKFYVIPWISTALCIGSMIFFIIVITVFRKKFAIVDRKTLYNGNGKK